VYGLIDSTIGVIPLRNFSPDPRQCKALTIAPCIFWRDVPWDDKRLTLIKFTDDLAWNGSARTKEFFAQLLSNRWDVTIDHFWKTFVGMKIDCRS
jgi:hypothetical protein